MCRPFHHPLIITCKNIRRMFERVTHSGFSTRAVIAAGIACTLLAYGTTLAQAPQTPAAANGSYSILIRGYYTGDGVATVNGGVVFISAKVHDDSGRAGTLSATQITMVGDHFGGPATVMGMTVTLQGRVDAADPTTGNTVIDAAAIVTDARMQATFVDPHGHSGRLAGTKQKSATTTPAAP